MKYVLGILKQKLRFELQCEHDADEHINNAGGALTSICSKETIKAFQESRRLAKVRIPQLQKAIKLLTNVPTDKKQ